MPLFLWGGVAGSAATIGASLYLVGVHHDLARWLRRNRRPGLYGHEWGSR